LKEAGYAGIEIRVFAQKTEIRINAAKLSDVVGPNGQKIRELTKLIEQRFRYPAGGVDLKVKGIREQSLCAAAQCEKLKAKLLQGLPVRMAANTIIKSVMRDPELATGCEVIISGKLRQQRAKTMKFRQGYLISSGQTHKDFVDTAVRHVLFKQGIMGVKVRIMLSPKFKKQPLPDQVLIKDAKIFDQEEVRGPSQPPQQPGQGQGQGQ
jgi:small subunit ribosomal protein S3e